MELGLGLMRVVYLLAFLDLTSVSMVVTVLASYLREELGLSATAAGCLGSLYGIVQFFSSPLVGRYGDSHGYGRTLLVCCCACVPAYALLGVHSALLVAASRVAAGLFKHTQNLARTLVATFGSEEEKVAAYGRLNAIGNLGFLVGPAIGASSSLNRYPQEMGMAYSGLADGQLRIQCRLHPLLTCLWTQRRHRPRPLPYEPDCVCRPGGKTEGLHGGAQVRGLGRPLGHHGPQIHHELHRLFC